MRNKLYRFKHFILLLTLPLITTSLFSCGGSTIGLSIKCDDDCNSNNAVVIRIYQLKNGEKFLRESRESLLKSAEEVLGDDIVNNSKVEKTMIPGELYSFSDFRLDVGTRYIGIYADFYTPAKDQWRKLIDTSNDLKDMVIIIGKNSLSISMDD